MAIAVAALITWATLGTGTFLGMSSFQGAWVGAFGGSTFAATVATGALAGFASGAIMTGSLSGAVKGAMWGAISAGVAYGIGHGELLKPLVEKGGNFGKAIMHGISRAAISKAQGGRWSSGFWSGFAADYFSPGTEMGGKGPGGLTLRTTIAGVVGGTVSEVTGGKFANGAVTGAFVHLFNFEMTAKDFSIPKIAAGPDKDGNWSAEVVKPNYTVNTKKIRTELASDLGKIADAGAVIHTTGVVARNPIAIIGGECIDISATTLKIIIDSKSYELYEIFNEYSPFWAKVTPLE